LGEDGISCMEEASPIGRLEDFAPGRIHEFEVNGRPICAVKLDGQVYAFDRFCTHEYVELTYGFVWDKRVHCGQHGAVFSLETGAAEQGPTDLDIKVYPTRVQDEVVLVEHETRA
jgi:nitrite reductase/ring-hydroxylating ferredoxin subunit